MDGLTVLFAFQGERKLTDAIWKKMRGDGCMDRSLSAGSLTGIFLCLFFHSPGCSKHSRVFLLACVSSQSRRQWAGWFQASGPHSPPRCNNTGRHGIQGTGLVGQMKNPFPERAAATWSITWCLQVQMYYATWTLYYYQISSFLSYISGQLYCINPVFINSWLCISTRDCVYPDLNLRIL